MEGNGLAISERLLGPKEVQQLVGFSETHIRELMERKEFPTPEPRRSPLARRAWRASKIDAWRRGEWRPGDGNVGGDRDRPGSGATAPRGTDAQWSPDVTAARLALEEHWNAQQALVGPRSHAQQALGKAKSDIAAADDVAQAIATLKAQRPSIAAAVYSGLRDRVDLETHDAMTKETEAASAQIRARGSEARAALPLLQRSLEEAARHHDDVLSQRPALLYAFGEAVCMQLADEVVREFNAWYEKYEELWECMRSINQYVGGGRNGLMPMTNPTPLTIGVMRREDARWPAGFVTVSETEPRKTAALHRLAKRLEGLIPETTSSRDGTAQ